jgi:hypothetical protein
MEARGGNGYIEDFPNARLVRDAHLGLLWEGTSNINALDAVQRAVGKARAHEALKEATGKLLEDAPGLPGQFRTRLNSAVTDATGYAEQVAAVPEYERFSRIAAGKLYHATTAALLAAEGTRLGKAGGDARRLLLSRFVLEHRLADHAPAGFESQRWEDEAITLLLDDAPVPLAKASALVQG